MCGCVDDGLVSAAANEIIAVLMTDLERSTAMAERLGPAAAEELRLELFALLRGALERNGGREVKSLGDGLMVVFDGAAQSLACAVQMQQAVEAHNRRAEEKLGVRVGVSLGDATVEGGDYYGKPVVEAARLCAHATGGQIVITDLLYRVAGSRDGQAFEPLGGLELKGISEPVQAFELRWEPAPIPGMALPERLRELPATAFVGREAERERMAELWGEACGGSLRVALLSGEPGIGKTRLSIHLALEVHGEGSTVLYGRCDEDLGVHYLPWVQALSHLVKEAPRSVIDKHVERFGGDLARLIPALRERVPDLPSPRESDPETERYLMYAAVEGLLEGAGGHEPLLLILDDLHWADAPTLSLLRHVVSASSFKNVMVVGSFRDSDLSRDHPLTSLLAVLHREQGVERVKLTGFDSGDMAALMEVATGHELEEDGRALAAEITRETAGNPFFAGEVLRHLTESGAIVQEDGRWRLTGSLADLGLPQSVREVIGQRVEHLGADARTVLSAAAVIGREFDLELLRAVLDFSEDRLLDLLDQAVAASLLQEGSGQAERFTFIHALVEHTLYEDLGRAQRHRLHKRVAEALEEQCGDSPGERLGELSRHWAAAVVSADATKAIHYARLAAERALEQLAPQEAARWYRQALELQGQTPKPDRSERCELLIGLGEAQRQTGNQEFRQTLLDAAALAQELGETARLCRAVVANSRGWTSQTGAVDSERVQALEAAAGALADNDPQRARVLSVLASELHFGSDPARCRAMAIQANAIARAAGDPATLGHTIFYATGAILVPNTLRERKALSEELVELAQPLGDPRLSFMGAARQWVVSLEAGDRPHAESALTAIRALAASVPEPTFAWAQLLYEAVLALLQGDLQAAEQWAIQAFEAGKASGQPDAILLFGAQLANLRSFQDRSGELVEELAQFVGEPDSLPAWRAAAAIALIESGRADEARELAFAEDFKSVRWDMLWLVTMWAWADACSRLGLKDCAGELYELLQPFAGQVAARSIVVSGSIDWALGVLATTLERYEQAEGHFAAAAEIDERFGGPLFLVRTRVGWARALIARGRPEDLERAQQVLEQAEEVAERLGAGLVSREVAEGRTSLATIGA
jgi:class 3 adenylate cyclase/tetratricopeptide (TPR) repeat protein